jgi:hypothetical protein
MGGLRQFFKENPQVLLLLVISLVLGIGTFIAVLVAVALSGSGRTDGEPSDVIVLGHTLLGLGRSLFDVAGPLGRG